MVIATHNGDFHADDVCACAVLLTIYPDAEIVRTRDEHLLQKADIVFDVGGVYNPAQGLFDHHQRGGAGTRENGILYSSFGLVWKEYGERFCSSQDVATYMDADFVQGIDAHDTGIPLYTPLFSDIQPLDFDTMVGYFSDAWGEESGREDERFLYMVGVAQAALKRMCVHADAILRAREVIVSTYQSTPDKRIIELQDYCPWKDILTEFPEPLFVLFPDRGNEGCVAIQAVPDTSALFKSRTVFPESWRGLVGEELARVSGISDAGFCHNAGFFAVADSWDGARKMARLALDA